MLPVAEVSRLSHERSIFDEKYSRGPRNPTRLRELSRTVVPRWFLQASITLRPSHSDLPCFLHSRYFNANISQERYVWFYVEVHAVCTQDVVADTMGRSPLAIRLLLMRLRERAKNLTKQGVPQTDD